MAKGRKIRLSREQVLDIIAKNPKRVDQLKAAGYSSQGWYNIVAHYGLGGDKAPKPTPAPVMTLDIGLPDPNLPPVQRSRAPAKGDVPKEEFIKAFEANGNVISRTAKALGMNVMTCRSRAIAYNLPISNGREQRITYKPKTEPASQLNPVQKERLEIAWAGLADAITDYFGGDGSV